MKNAQIKSVTLTFPCKESLSQCKLVVYCNASYKNLENGDLQYSFGNLSLITWQSKKIC